MKMIGITRAAILALLIGVPGPVYAWQDQHDEKQDHPEQQQNRHEQAKPENERAEQREPEQRQLTQQQDENKQQERAQQQQQSHQQDRQEQNQQQQRAQEQKQSGRDRQEQHAQESRQQGENKQQERAQQPRHPEKAGQQEAQQQRTKPQPGLARSQQQRVQQSAWQDHRAQSWQSDHRTWRQRGGYHGYRIPDDRYRGYFGAGHGFRIQGLPFLVVGGYPRFRYQGYWISTIDPWPEYWANDWYDTDEVYVTYIDNGYYLFNQRYPDVGISISISM